MQTPDEEDAQYEAERQMLPDCGCANTTSICAGGRKTRALKTQIAEGDFLELVEGCHTGRGTVAPATPSVVLPGML
ncbi:hypothetical protein CVT26_011520 [Gymnopilus dilepis]|uniref:Uncharacterized protein n=1 Tax=Gymnopilus dilepis TaxID=231916 RepID=A0A409W5N1_9AGAR|nr:hypothetical protein CVT26_011520 [Gymnopilus dilepis]